MKFSTDKLTRTFGKFALKVKDHLPQILVGTGIIAGGATVYYACKGTVKTLPALAEANERLEEIQTQEDEATEHGLTLDAESMSKAKNEAYSMVVKSAVKNYAPAVTFGIISVTSILVGTHILHKRNLAWAAAYATLNESFDSYRKNIVETFGEQADQNAYHNVKTEYETDDETGEVTEHVTVTPGSGYGRFFDEVCGSNAWSRDPNYNYLFLRARQDEANIRLRTQGYLFLNELYRMLGIEETVDGQLVGWVYDEDANNGNSFVQIDVVAYDDSHNPYMVNVGEDMPDSITDGMYIDFNVQGPVLEKIRNRKLIRER